jgi:L-alanine-DL-glutamate epimerase-like enolase superfamily enzyme
VERASSYSARLSGARRQSRVKLSHEVISLHTRYPFVIARGGYAAHENVIVTIQEDDGLAGFGEAAPNR